MTPLAHIVQNQGVALEDLAQLLFPYNAHPLAAIRRACVEGSELNASQIKRLSLYTDLPVETLTSYLTGGDAELNFRIPGVVVKSNKTLTRVVIGGQLSFTVMSLRTYSNTFSHFGPVGRDTPFMLVAGCINKIATKLNEEADALEAERLAAERTR